VSFRGGGEGVREEAREVEAELKTEEREMRWLLVLVLLAGCGSPKDIMNPHADLFVADEFMAQDLCDGAPDLEIPCWDG
jgi:hypothetical protein